MKESNCLIVASIFAPIRGGSATVYENIARLSGDRRAAVLATWRHYGTGMEIDGWREHDARCGYPVSRLELLRPRILPPPRNKLVSVWRQLATDIPLKLKVAVSALKLVKEHGIGVVCIGELVSGAWIGHLLRRMTGAKLVFYVHGEEITTRYATGSFGAKRLKTLQGADAIVAVSRFTADTLEKDFGVRRDRIFLIPNGVDTERFTSGPDDGVLRSRYNLGDGPIILCVGRLVPRKGFDQTIRAMPAVLDRVPDARLVIVGEGDQMEELKGIAASLGVAGKVCFTGPVSQEDLVRAYRASALFAMPNRTMPDGDTEGFGLVFLEANACGRTVVGGRAGGAVDAIVDRETGLLVNGEDVQDIANAIIAILTDVPLRTSLEKGGLEHARANDWRARAKIFRGMCERLVGGGAP